MKNAFFGLLGSIIMLMVGAFLVINLVDFGMGDFVGYQQQYTDSYFGFQSFINAIETFTMNMSKLNFTPTKIFNAFNTLYVKVLSNEGTFVEIILSFFGIALEPTVLLLSFIWYVIAGLGMLLLVIIGCLSGTFSMPYHYSEIDEMFPLMMYLHQFN